MFVGVTSRVTCLSRQEASTPDELDAIGKSRGCGFMGATMSVSKPLNQLLTEMDGFDASGTTNLSMATNRPESLDPALRPGRFDRQVLVTAEFIRTKKF